MHRVPFVSIVRGPLHTVVDSIYIKLETTSSHVHKDTRRVAINEHVLNYSRDTRQLRVPSTTSGRLSL